MYGLCIVIHATTHFFLNTIEVGTYVNTLEEMSEWKEQLVYILVNCEQALKGLKSSQC